MAPAEMPPSAAAPRHDLAAVERAAESKLQTCRRVAAAIDGVVDTLSGAGSGLRKTLAEALGGPEGLEHALASEDPLIQRAAHSAFHACEDIGAALIGLAVALSGELQQPLQDLERAVHADRLQRTGTLEQLRRRHQACTGALTESLRRKERLSLDLKAALEEVEHEKRGIRFPWLGRAGKADEPDSKLQKAMLMQSAAVEEYSACVEQTMELSNSAQEETEALSEALEHVDFAVKRTLQTSLRRCSGAWKSVAGTLVAAAQQLSDDSAHVVQDVLPPLKVSKRPSWANGLFKPLTARGGKDGGSDCPEPKAGANKLADAQRLSLEHVLQGTPSPVRKHQEPETSAGAPSKAPAAAQAPQAPEDPRLLEGWAELEAQRRAARESHEAREIQLLEQEENLRGMQAQLDSQLKHVAESRRSLALNQARCIALLESPKVSQTHGRTEYISLDGGKRSSSRSPEHVALDGKVEVIAPLAEAGESESEGEEDKGAHDAVWDMDWTLARTLSGKVIEKEPKDTAQTSEDSQTTESPAASTTVATPDSAMATAQDALQAPEIPEAEELPAVATVVEAPDARAATTQVGPASDAQAAVQTLAAPAGSLEVEVAGAVEEEGGSSSNVDDRPRDAQAPEEASKEVPAQDVASVPSVPEKHSERNDSSVGAEAASPHRAPSVCSSSATASPQQDSSHVPWASSSQPRAPRRPLARSSGEDGSGSNGGPTEFQALRERMQQTRKSREIEPSPRAANKGRMPGVHPDIAEKLEARRRLVDAMEATSPQTSPM